MKRTTAFYLALSLCAALTGCGRGSTTPTESAAISHPAQETKPESPQTQLLPEQVIFDSDGIRITVKGMEEATMAGTRIRLLVENATQKNIVLSGDLFVVNGVTMPGYLYAEAAAGTKTNDAIELYGDSLEAAGIVEIQTIRGYDIRIVDKVFHSFYEPIRICRINHTVISHNGVNKQKCALFSVFLYKL